MPNNENGGNGDNVASSLVGTIEKYNDGHDFSNWLERFEIFCSINRISNEKLKTQYLIVFGGQFLYDKIKIICSPKAASDVDFSEVSPQLQAMLKKVTSESVERQKFYSRVQQSGETVAEYAFALKQLSSNCNFGNFL